jgi:hypothetical protein
MMRSLPLRGNFGSAVPLWDELEIMRFLTHPNTSMDSRGEGALWVVSRNQAFVWLGALLAAKGVMCQPETTSSEVLARPLSTKTLFDIG